MNMNFPKLYDREFSIIRTVDSWDDLKSIARKYGSPFYVSAYDYVCSCDSTKSLKALGSYYITLPFAHQVEPEIDEFKSLNRSDGIEIEVHEESDEVLISSTPISLSKMQRRCI